MFIEPKAGLFYLYVLLCKGGKFYIGVTKNPKKRFDEHTTGKGAKFTKKHKPVAMLKMKPLGKMSYREAEYYENLCTLYWKHYYGNESVSGGIYVHRQPSRLEIKTIINDVSKKEFRKIPRPSMKDGKVSTKQKRIKKRKPTVEDYLRKSKKVPEINVGFTKPKLGKKTGIDGLRGLIKKV